MKIYSQIHFYIALAIVVSISILVGLGVFYQDLDIVLGILLVVFGSLTGIAGYFLLLLLLRGDTFGIESSLPNIDGSSGGWRLSRSLTFFVLAALFSIAPAFIYAALRKEEPNDNSQKVANASEPKKKQTMAKDSLKIRSSQGTDTTQVR